MMLHSPLQLNNQPKRIVSLVPSQTELLFHLELNATVAGITKFCIHPLCWKKEKKIIGGTKDINLEKINAINPDLIIANKEENVKEQVEALAAQYNVWVTDVSNLEESLQMINDIGSLTHTKEKAGSIVSSIKQQFNTIHPSVNKIRTAYLIWRNPYMTVGRDTFIHDMLTRSGFENIYRAAKRYPVIDIETLQQQDCELLLLSSEPYPFKQIHIDELQQQLPQTKIMLVDGELFSWYGSRLLYAPDYFNQLLQTL
jgi:ABC-type Fe3+-hydroxamate transport system substrate-binding protein